MSSNRVLARPSPGHPLKKKTEAFADIANRTAAADNHRIARRVRVVFIIPRAGTRPDRGDRLPQPLLRVKTDQSRPVKAMGPTVSRLRSGRP